MRLSRLDVGAAGLIYTSTPRATCHSFSTFTYRAINIDAAYDAPTYVLSACLSSGTARVLQKSLRKPVSRREANHQERPIQDLQNSHRNSNGIPIARFRITHVHAGAKCLRTVCVSSG